MKKIVGVILLVILFLQLHSFAEDFVILNLKNNKYHKPDCEYGQKAVEFEKLTLDEAKTKYEAANCCFKANTENFGYRSSYAHSVEIVSPDFSKTKKNLTTGIKLLYNSPIEFNYKPSEVSRTPSGKVLIEELNKLKREDIYIATYGIMYQPEIIEAFVKAEKRRNKVYGVADVDINNRSSGRDTFYAMKTFGKWRTDYEVDKAIADRIASDRAKGIETEKGTYNGNLMHNKFVTLGKTKVWTGSTNLTSSGTGGLNSNLNALITSPEITYAYIKESKQMFSGKFHYLKTPYHMKNIKLDDGSIVSVYFCPNPDVVDEIVSMIDSSEKYVYVAMFFLTHDRIINALVEAKKRGVDVKVITCASASQETYSKHHKIREKSVPVKVENWTGKQHMKTIISDDKRLTVGSMNATTTAELKNDENIVFITNPAHTIEARKIFEEQWQNIPDKWLTQTPRAEGPESGNSCNDGIDNDHNGKYDRQDPKCADFDYSKVPN